MHAIATDSATASLQQLAHSASSEREQEKRISSTSNEPGIVNYIASYKAAINMLISVWGLVSNLL